jgi:Leucine-rich repeat (LRR) protein
VSEEDDLFDAGLSSISAARLREALDACTGLTLPLNLIYEHTTVPALAAALLLLLKRAASGAGAAAGAGAEARAPSRADDEPPSAPSREDDEPPSTDDDAGHITSGGAGAVKAGACDGAVEEEEEEPSLLLPRATEAFRQGALSRAEALCLRAAARLGITPLLIRQSACFGITPGAPPQTASSAMGAVPGASLGAVPGASTGAVPGASLGAVPGVSLSQLPTAAATAPVLVLLIGVWSLQERWAEAAEACDWLLTLRAVDCLIRSSGAVPQGLRNRHALLEAALSTMSTRELLDTALVTMQMARFAAAAGDASAATTALACADAALTGYQAALGTALRSPQGLTESAVSSAPQRAAETDEIDETPFEDADGHVPEAPTTARTPHTGVESLARAQLPTTALPSPLPTERGWWSMHSATLTTLSVRRRALVELPEALGGLRALRVLDASENRLHALPDDLSHLIELGELLLSSNDFSQLPSWLADLPQLHVLSLQDNAFASLPPVVLRCAKLKHLRWGLQRRTRAAEGGDEGELSSDGAVSSSTPRVELDTTGAFGSPHLAVNVNTTGAFASPHLAVLELEGNDQTSLPLLPMHASALTALLASFNRLHDPPSPLTLTPPQAPPLTPTPPLTRPPTQLLEQLMTTHLGRHLKRLQLGSNGIVSVAELLPALPNVSTLCLEANRLTELPRCIGQLRQLRELWLFGNQLRQLPEELGECAQLTKLEAHHNRLLDLPTSLRKLTKLKSLYVQANELTNLAELRERVLRHLPLLNLGLGANQFDLKVPSPSMHVLTTAPLLPHRCEPIRFEGGV